MPHPEVYTKLQRPRATSYYSESDADDPARCPAKVSSASAETPIDESDSSG